MDHSFVFDIIMILDWMWLGKLSWGRNVYVTLERKVENIEIKMYSYHWNGKWLMHSYAFFKMFFVLSRILEK